MRVTSRYSGCTESRNRGIRSSVRARSHFDIICLVRFVPILIVVALISPAALAQDRDALRDARSVAESMVVASGPVRAASLHVDTRPVWRANRNLAGSYRDVSARHRFTRYTYGWQGWYGHWSHFGPGPRACGLYRCW